MFVGALPDGRANALWKRRIDEITRNCAREGTLNPIQNRYVSEIAMRTIR